MAIVIALVLVVALAAFVLAPVLRGPRPESEEPRAGEDPERADLEARKEALYRQIRDAELDREQGKLSGTDWARVDADLRREAIDVLKQIDALSLD